MTTISGVRIHPGFFNKRKPTFTENRAGASPSRLKPTVVRKPKALKGKYAMPVIAVVAAFVATSSAVAAVAAVGWTAASVFSVITAVGAVTAAVGAVTGNQKLMKIGSVIGIAGMVGGFAVGQGWIGGGADAGASGASGVGGGPGGDAGAVAAIEGGGGESLSTLTQGSGGNGTSMLAADAAEQAAPIGDGGGDFVQPGAEQTATNVSGGEGTGGSFGGEAPPENPSPFVDDASAAYTPPDQLGVAPKVADPVADLNASIAQPSSAAQPAPSAERINDWGGGGSDSATGNPINAITTPTSFDKMMSMFSDLGKTASKNPGLTSALLQGIAGAASGKNSAEVDYIKSRTESENANTERTKQLTRNMSSAGGNWRAFQPSGSMLTAPRPRTGG